MSEVQSVNQDPQPIPDSEASDANWVDPIFAEKAASRLPDDPDETDSQAAAPEKGELTAEQIKALVDANPDEEEKPAEGEAVEAKEPEEGDEDDDTEEAKEGEQPQVGKPPRRRSKARRERRAMQREMAELRAQVAALTKPAEEAKPAEQAKPEPPKLEAFDYDTEKWAAAVTDWTQNLVDSGKEEVRKAEEAKQAKVAEEARREAQEAFTKRQDDARDKYGDDEFDAAYEKATHVNLPDAVVDLIIASDVGAEVAYYLGTHDEEAAKFAGMTEAQIAREVGRIEARIAAEQAKAAEAAKPAAEEKTDNENGAEEAKPAAQATTNPPPQQRKPVTKAPDPVPTVSGGAAHTRDPSKMSQDEYKAARMSGQLR